MAFEVFDKRTAPTSKVPSVTIQKRGIISMNKAAHELINQADSIELLFDKANQIIGIRPAEPAPHTYKFRSQSKSGQAIVSATAFTQFYEIDTSVSRRWKPYEQDGILCIDLKSKSTEVVGNRSKPSPEKADEDS